MNKLTFVTLATPGRPTLETLLMAASVRQFAGELANTPVWVLAPETHWPFSDSEREKLNSLGVHLEPFELDPELLKFPFAAKIIAAAHAEKMAKDACELLAWFDRDTLFINPPNEFLLPADKSLGYRPVHHKLIGPAWGEPPGPFWELIYQIFDIPSEHIFPMTTHLGELIRPYFNAGTFVVRPESGLLSEWRDSFLDQYRKPEFQVFYEQDSRYAIFIHQAVWTAILLKRLDPEQMLELSSRINYPLHLHEQVPHHLRPTSTYELVTARCEDIFASANWKKLPFEEFLRTWLSQQPLLQANQP